MTGYDRPAAPFEYEPTSNAFEVGADRKNLYITNAAFAFFPGPLAQVIPAIFDPVVKFGFRRGLEPINYVNHIIERYPLFKESANGNYVKVAGLAHWCFRAVPYLRLRRSRCSITFLLSGC